jgi:SAM-dependent methyltransferase
MPVRWLVDDAANAALWRDLEVMPLRLVDGPGRWVADLGGGNGNFVGVLREKGARLLTLDVDVPALRSAPRDIRTVAASILNLPLRTGSVDAAAGRAVLHHVPDDLDTALRETRRVLRPGGLVLFQEPTSGNPIANAARRRFPTERHDPHERPLAYDAYVAAVRRHFEILEARPHFLLSYLLPHLVGRLPPNRRGLPRALTRLLAAWDRRLLAALPGLRSRAAYGSILARVPLE